jgi:hypothetical protein
VLPADEEPAEQQGLRRREEAATAAAAVAGRSLRLLHHVQHPRAHLQAPRLRGASPSWISLCFPLAQKPPARFSSRLVRDLLRCSGFPEMPDACSWLALFFFWGQDCRESQFRAYWFSRNDKIIDRLLADRSSVICLQVRPIERLFN